MKTTALLVAVLAVASLSTVIAHNTICLNGNTQITKLFVDGEDYTKQLANRLDPFHCDCFSLPPNTGTIAVKARSRLFQVNKAGILACETDDHADYSDWVCASSRLTKKINGKSWYEPGYLTHNRRVWSNAVSSSCQRPCRHKKVLQCKTNSCFWSKQITTSVNCIKRSCADGCLGCDVAGPGKCDPGKCKFGSSLNELKNVEACNRTCNLEVSTWGSPTGTGYIKLTDAMTKSVSKYPVNTPGAYLAVVDMDSCNLIMPDYQPWANEPAHSTLLNNWVYNTTLKNLVAVEVGAGDTAPPTSYAPWIALQQLGVGNANYLNNVGDMYTSVTATLTGVSYGVVSVTNVVTLPTNPGP